jgi:adenylate cyclase
LAKVFLSYAREDVDIARQLAEWVGRAGHEVWWDRHIHGGTRFSSEIDRALKDAEAVVVIWSDASVDSAWVQDEATEGRDSGRLVPIRLGRSRPPLGFRQFHCIPLGNWDGSGEPEALTELLTAIAKASGAQPEQQPAAPQGEQRKQYRASVCVLPFVNMSGDPEQEYFSDGITEDIITDLSKVSSLSVIARNTAFAFKGRSSDVKEIATSLGVSHVLEGSVRKAGSRVRITAQLIDGTAGDHLWADRYDRELTDIFAIQDEISKAIVDALQVKLLPDERRAIQHRGTASVDAYNLYLMARQQWISGTYGDVRKDEAIVRMCKQAVLLDPEYAQAWALMALAQAELRFWHGTTEDALPAAEQALAISAELPEAMCVKARYLEQDGHADEAVKVIERALQLDPESWEVNREAARFMFREGRIRDAIPYFEKAMSLMSGDFHSGGMLFCCYNGIGDKENARRVAEMTLERCKAVIAKDPANGMALTFGATSLMMFGDLQRAKEWAQRALLLDPDNLSMLYNLACAFACEAHDIDYALDLMDRFFERTNSPIILKHLGADPDMDAIRDHPRFRQGLSGARKRLGLDQPSPVKETALS